MNDKPTIDLHTLKPITKFIYTIGALPTSYLMSMTYPEQLTWLCNYIMQTLIPNMNENTEAVQELQELYELLQKYVNDYFDNLDVQEEIDNKLNEMATDGTLTNLIKNYVDPFIAEQNNNIQNIENNVTSSLNTISNAQIEIINNQNSLDSRMDTFTSLAEGSTTGDAELEDIRIGYTGITETSAGSSVRNQIEDVRNIAYNYNIGYERLITEYILGNVNNQGIWDSTYRIRSKNKLSFPFPITIIRNYGDFQIVAVTYTTQEATTGTNVSNRGGLLYIPANTLFHVCCRRVTEDQTETADIYEFQKNIVYFNELYRDNLFKIYENYSNLKRTIYSNEYTSTNLSGILTTGKYYDAWNMNETSLANGQYLKISSGFNAGDIIKVKGYSATNYDEYPALSFINSKMVIKKISLDSSGEKEIITYIPYGTEDIIINGSVNLSILPKCEKLTYMQQYKNYPLNIAESLIREAKKNPFAFSTFDKGYISFVFDDTRSDMDLVASVFAEYGFKLGLATVPANLSKTCDGLESSSEGYTVGMTRKAVCDRVVLLGGEVLSHNMDVITVSNQYDYNFMYNYFITTKQDLEKNGYNVRGLIRAGGNGAISGTNEIEKWLIGNYEYSNQGIAVNYSQDRVNITTNKDTLKSQILDAYNNHTWIKIMGHGISETTSGNDISLSDLREILSYCETIGITVVTYADMFDNFSSSQFLNSVH